MRFKSLRFRQKNNALRARIEQPGVIFMQVQKNHLTNYSNEYKLRAKVIQMHNNFANGKEGRGCGDVRCVLRHRLEARRRDGQLPGGGDPAAQRAG